MDNTEVLLAGSAHADNSLVGHIRQEVNLNGYIRPEISLVGSMSHPLTGTMPTTAVLYTEQTLTDEEKEQARTNIGALSTTTANEAYNTLALRVEEVEDVTKTHADWNQNDAAAPDYICNKTHWIESSCDFDITWDGSTDGRDMFDVLGDGSYVYYKISDEVFIFEDLDGSNIEVGSETFTSECNNVSDEINIAMIDGNIIIISTSTLTPPDDFFPEGLTFPSTGTYCLHNSTGETIHLYKEQSTIHQLPMMYLPEVVQHDAGKTLLYREDAGKFVYRATAHIDVGQGFAITNLSTIISEQIIAEAMSCYSVIIVSDDNETTQQGILGECISGLVLDIGPDRKCQLTSSWNVDVGTVYDFSGKNISIYVYAQEDIAMSPHAYYVNQSMIAPEVDWVNPIDESQTNHIPTVETVYDGLKAYAQTYTTYEENISEEPIVITLQNQTFYNFGTTPKITIDRSKVVALGTYCGFIFQCGDTATELYEKGNIYGNASGYPLWNVHCSIKPHRSYKCIIQHGEPFLTEYVANDINTFENIFTEVKRHTFSNAEYYFNPSTIQTGDDNVSLKYSSLKLKIGVDPEVFEQAYNEIVTAYETAQKRTNHEQIPFTLSAYTAVGGEKYYPANSTSRATATEGQHLIKITIPPFSEDYANVHYYSAKWYICVKNGTATTMNYKTGKTYALTSSRYPTEETTIYILPSTDDSVITINTDISYAKYSYSRISGYSQSSSGYLPGVLQSATWNSLKESETQATTDDNG